MTLKNTRDPEKGISTERQKELIELAEAAEAKRVKDAEDYAFAHAEENAPKVSVPVVPEWRESPGIEAMDRAYNGHSQALTRESPPQQKRKITLQEAMAEARRRGWTNLVGTWRSPFLKRQFLEEFLIDPATMPEPLPIPESVDHHARLHRERAAAASKPPIVERMIEVTKTLLGVATTDDPAKKPKKPNPFFHF